MLRTMLLTPTGALKKELGEGGLVKSEKAQQQREEYRRRGIALVAYDAEATTRPYFTNLDEDAFRSNRFMYILSKVLCTV
jgi:hypothetical protein